MDAKRRVDVEKKAVMALLVVFVLTLAGSLRHLGLFGRGNLPAPVQVKITMPAPVTSPSKMLETYHERMIGADQLRGASEPGAGRAAEPSIPPRYTASSGRDPMISLLPEVKAVDRRAAGPWTNATAATPGPTQPPALRLQGVLLGGLVPQAIINNKVYRVGESINGARITAIERHSVQVEFNGVTTRYTISGGSGR